MSEPTALSPCRLENEFRLGMLRTMLRIRGFEEGVAASYLRGMTAGSMIHLSVGEEAAATGIASAMQPEDFFTTHHRGHGIFIARGADMRRMMAEIWGKIDGYCKGKGGSMHIADIHLGHMGSNAIVGGNIPISVGGGFALNYLGLRGVSVAFFGDGALQQGVLYESLNLAALWKLPVVFAVINNQYGMGTRIDRASATQDFAKRAEWFGLSASTVDGMDVEAVYTRSRQVLDDVRAGGGPAFVVATCYRYYGHGRMDPSPYRDRREEEQWKARDPVQRYAERLISDGVLGSDQLERMHGEIRSEVDAAQRYAQSSALPGSEELYTDVYAGPGSVEQQWRR